MDVIVTHFVLITVNVEGLIAMGDKILLSGKNNF